MPPQDSGGACAPGDRCPGHPWPAKSWGSLGAPREGPVGYFLWEGTIHCSGWGDHLPREEDVGSRGPIVLAATLHLLCSHPAQRGSHTPPKIFGHPDPAPRRFQSDPGNSSRTGQPARVLGTQHSAGQFLPFLLSVFPSFFMCWELNPGLVLARQRTRSLPRRHTAALSLTAKLPRLPSSV